MKPQTPFTVECFDSRNTSFNPYELDATDWKDAVKKGRSRSNLNRYHKVIVQKTSTQEFVELKNGQIESASTLELFNL